jgi:tetratricopeptide (TPR) repeat protein
MCAKAQAKSRRDAADQHRESARAVPRFRSRKVIVVSLVLAAVLSGGIAVYIWQRAAAIEPPVIQLAGVDPAVAEAIDAARAAVIRSPRSGKAWGQLGMVLYAHHFLNEAAPCFGQAEKLDPSEPRWPYLEGGILQHTDTDAAIAKYRRAADLSSEGLDSPGLALGDLLLSLGRLDEAEREFTRLPELDESNARARLGLGRLAFFRGDYSASLAHLRQAAQDKHTCQAAHLLMAEVYQRKGDLQSAQEERRQAAEAPADLPWPAPMDAEVKSLETGEQANLARQGQLMDQGKLAEAVALLQQTVRDYPTSARAWGLLGDGYLKMKDLGRAEEALTRAAQLGSNSLEVPLDLGLVYLLRGDRQTALLYFRQVIQKKPDFALAHFYIGRCLLQAGDRAGALGAFEAALRCKPDIVQAHTACAELLIAERRWPEALQHLGYARAFGAADERTKALVGRILREITIPAGRW